MFADFIKCCAKLLESNWLGRNCFWLVIFAMQKVETVIWLALLYYAGHGEQKFSKGNKHPLSYWATESTKNMMQTPRMKMMTLWLMFKIKVLPKCSGFLWLAFCYGGGGRRAPTKQLLPSPKAFLPPKIKNKRNNDRNNSLLFKMAYCAPPKIFSKGYRTESQKRSSK